MSFAHRFRLPISTRHAFALAFDLALRRDALHSLVTPLLVRGPWVLAVLLLPKPDETARAGNPMLLSSLAVLGSFVTWIAVDAMLRFRARSVFNTPPDTRPAPVIECYSRGLRRVPWLYLTEFVRGAALAFAFPFFVLPGIFLGHRLAFSTEAVVLDDRNLASAFQHSFKLSEGRFERWFEMIVVSVLIVLSALFVMAALSMVVPGVSWSVWVIAGWMLVAAIWPVIQYAWTFFYLRLVESEEPAGVEVGPLYAEAPSATPSSWTSTATAPSPSHLTLVEPHLTPPEEDRTA
jgi:hypothetical protein